MKYIIYNAVIIGLMGVALKCGSSVACADVLTSAQKSYFENRRICVRRDTTTLPGYVITYWHRNGKPDTKGAAVVTNKLQNVQGAKQHNPLQELAEQWRAAAEQWRTAATNNAARVERVNAALDEKRAEYVQKRDAATLPTTKAIYQAFIDAIDRIKENMEGARNGREFRDIRAA